MNKSATLPPAMYAALLECLLEHRAYSVYWASVARAKYRLKYFNEGRYPANQ